MVQGLVIGAILFGLGLTLLLVGLPKKGVSPRFLQFEAAAVLYPPLIMLLVVSGAAEILDALF